MAGEWLASTWGDEVSLEYGKALRGHDVSEGPYRVFGSNGPIGWTSEPLAPGPGVILGRKGAYRGVQFSHDPFFVIDTAYFIVPKHEMEMRWLYYAVKHYKLGEIDDGSPIPSTTRAAVYMRDLEVPPRPEQRAIAHILGTLDDKIELNRRMNETLEAMARALFKSWFVDFDPVRAKAAGRDPGLPKALADLFPARLVPSELGEIPEGWDVVPLDQIADYVNGAACQKYPPKPGEPTLPAIKIRELNQGISDQTDRVHSEIPDKHRTNDGDVLFSWSGTLTCKVWTGGPGFVNQHVFKVTSERVPRWLYLHWTNHHLDVFKGIAADKATTMGHIKRSHLTEALTVIPSDDLLGSMDELVSPLDARQVHAAAETRTLASIRDTLLPKLISGELRVRDAERFIERAT